MDPNATLAIMLAAARKILDGPREQSTEADELAESVQSLDSWIRKGGFLPDLWRYASDATAARTL
jgi:hypothetical protein